MSRIYSVTRQVTLQVEAETREEAIKYSKDWDGANFMCSTLSGALEWNMKSKLIGAKKSKKNELDNYT